MIQSIIDGIVAALREAFSDITDIYTEQVKQGLTEPCFIVKCINPASVLFLDKRYRKTNLFSVNYIPKSDTDAKIECYGVLDVLYDALEYITVDGDLVRGTEMRGEFPDNELVFLVNYNMFVRRDESTEKMYDLTIETEVMNDLQITQNEV